MAALAGAALGMIFFCGLWWTVQRAAASPRPALWFGPSLLLRCAAVGAGFCLVADGTWPPLAACLAGFALTRMAVLRIAPRFASLVASRAGAQHAP